MPILKRRLSSKPSTSTSSAPVAPVVSSETAATILILNPEPNGEDSAHPLSISTESVVSESESSSSSHAESITTYSAEEDAYLLSLSTIERKVCFIAQQHLESSFDMSRSSGFIAWKNKK